VIRRRGLGDALVTLPAVRQLAATFPLAEVDLVLDRALCPLFAALAPDLRVLAWPPADDRPRSWLRRLRARRYDLVLDFLGSPRTALWAALSGAPWRVGYDHGLRAWAYNTRIPRNRTDRFALTEFAGESFLDPVQALAANRQPWRPFTAAETGANLLGEPYRQWVEQWPETGSPRVGLFLGASWSAKAWPARHICRLYRLLMEWGAGPLLVCGPQEEELEQALRRELPAAWFAPPTDLLELADLLGRLDLFVGTDCGPRHLAACVGLPTVTLFGPTDPRGWNPEQPRHVALTSGVACSPCHHTVCPLPGHPCLEDLKADQVLGAIKDLWRKLRRPAPREGEQPCAGLNW